MPHLSRTVTIINERGLHARAAAKLVEVARPYQSRITIHREDGLYEEGDGVPATSILGLLMLVAEPGTPLIIKAEGEDAAAALDAIEQLILNRFTEDA